MKLNKEGLTFEEWVCAAGKAVFDGCQVRPYSKTETVLVTYYCGSIGTSDERFFDDVPRLKKKTYKKVFYSKKIRDAWRNGEDPTEHRT